MDYKFKGTEREFRVGDRVNCTFGNDMVIVETEGEVCWVSKTGKIDPRHSEEGSYCEFYSELEPVGPTYEPGKWYGWNGGECPVHPEDKVIAVIDGRNEFYSGIEPAGNFIWSHSGTADIVAFKIVEEYKPKAEPREFWVAFDSSGRHYIFTDVPYGWKNHIKVREVIE